MFSPAQTNTAFYCQLHEQGHSSADLQLAQRTYRASCQLFNGRYRKSERAFICHAVGVASALAYVDRRIEWILAGMLHAAYDSGQYSDGRSGPTAAHRQWLASQVGNEIEEIVAAYDQFDFDTGKPEALVQGGVFEGQSDLLLIALAHDVDDLADGGLAVAPKYGPSITERVAACATLARQIGHVLLA